MDSMDVVDEVNALLKLGVGDAYRLEHIKQSFIQNKNIWITDKNYLKRLREKYLIKQTLDDSSNEEIVFENEPENQETIHCWKCGKKGPLGANFCMICGSSLFEVGDNIVSTEPKSSKNTFKSIPLKIPIIVGIPLLVLIILGAGYSQGYFDNSFERSSSPDISPSPTVIVDEDSTGETDSKCGPGTVYDSESNSCILG
ncbi:zinc ribbon domain-containing protein [Nitrosopumilus sp.]|uniref:zinc ribbon domain-containing protein n=1 Tax=Nitrosopumilus sp. TaxID=2024843 RepID=UPI00247EC32B|nr:zinc ribbon domain-containing protein [Nitrosopumilus sp.]MCV0431535.1 zinc ribbon domain-containing protein [Nitrosopumilus sp.]